MEHGTAGALGTECLPPLVRVCSTMLPGRKENTLPLNVFLKLHIMEILL